MQLLEHAQSLEDYLQKENAADFLKENDELQNLRAVLQKKYSNLLGFGGEIFKFSSPQKKTEIYYYLLLFSSFLSISYVIDWSKYSNLLRFGGG